MTPKHNEAAANSSIPDERRAAPREHTFDHWHPGISSRIPREIRHLATLYRPENVFTELARADELADLTGLPGSELVAFRPERLALHELLIRVTADIAVSDGSRIEDLGINFRRIASTILASYVAPEMPAIVARYDALRRDLARDHRNGAREPPFRTGDDRDTSAFERLHAARTLRARAPGDAGAGRRPRRRERRHRRLGGSLARRRRAAGGRVPRAGADRIGARRPPRLDLGRSRYDRRDGAGPRLQRARQRRRRGADRPARQEGRRDGAVRAACRGRIVPSS